MEVLKEIESTFEVHEEPEKALKCIHDFLLNFKATYWVELETPLEDGLWNVFENVSSNLFLQFWRVL